MSFLAVEGVSKRFAPKVTFGARIARALGGAVEDRAVRAVESIDLAIAPGETVGLVGESGCGKSTLGRIAAGILPPTIGTVMFKGAPVMSAGSGRHRKLTTKIQTVFQDPFASLDPRMTIGATVAEAPLAHGLTSRADADAYVARWLERVGLPTGIANRYPHQFSGGQRQRIAIARALAMQPELLICDEPVASLDVSIQAQIINLFLDLKRELKLAMLFISHDLSVVKHLTDRVAIMYLGRIVETGPTRAVYADPKHPYTRALMEAVPRLDGGRANFKPITGEIPSPLAPPAGCHFNPRCPIAVARCRSEPPPLKPVGEGRRAACHLVAEA